MIGHITDAIWTEKGWIGRLTVYGKNIKTYHTKEPRDNVLKVYDDLIGLINEKGVIQ
jgi:hypothetical protein